MQSSNNIEKSSFLDNYRIIKTLGKGYHAKVKLAEAPNKQLVAIKRFKKETANLGTLKHELQIMSKLHHQNVVNLIEVKQNAIYRKKTGVTYNCFAIILEYVGGGQLFDFISLGGRFTPIVSRTYFHQMMNGLAHMHQNGIAHRDIKPQNILLTSTFILKLADFGFSALIQGKDKSGILHTKLGTQGYMAPEVQLKNYVGTQADIFSAGVILFIMYSGGPPFEQSVPNDQYYRLIAEKNYATFWSLHSKKKAIGFFTEQFKDLINGMLCYEPKMRFTHQQIVNHPWTKGPTISLEAIQVEFQNRKKKIQAAQEKQRLEKLKQKNLKSQALFNNSKFRGDNQNESQQILSVFVKNYHAEQMINRNIPVKNHIKHGDFIIHENETYFFSTLRTFLLSPLDIKTTLSVQQDQREKDQNQDLLQFTAVSQEHDNNKITIKFLQKHEDLKISTKFVEIVLLISKTITDNLCITFENISGNSLYYKILVNRIKQEFNYALVQ